MEIIDHQTGNLIANFSSSQPEFDVRGLDSERLLKIAVMAVNSRGVSDRVILEAQTLKAAEKRMGKCKFIWKVSIIYHVIFHLTVIKM